MQQAMEFLATRNPEFVAAFEAEKAVEGSVSMGTFLAHNVPMVVACTYCEMTMTLPGSYINENGQIFCRECASQG